MYNNSFVMMAALYMLCLAGFLISLYVLYAYRRTQLDPNFKAFCDISEHTSCTKVFGSLYGQHFGIPNGVYGLFYYSTMLFLLWQGYFEYYFYGTVIAVLVSIYLASVLITKVRSLCLECVTIYFINIANGIISFFLFYS